MRFHVHFAWLVVLVVGCENSPEISDVKLLDLAPHQALLADAVSVLEPAHGDCVIARRVELISNGDLGLELRSYQVPWSGCEAELVPEKLLAQGILRVTYDDGLKIYHGRSDTEEALLWDHRNQDLDGLVPWSLVVEGHQSTWTGKPNWTAFFFENVTDYNLAPQAPIAHEIELSLTAPMSMSALTSLVYPLLIDPDRSAPLDPQNPTAYRLTVMSDFSVDHVLSQLRPLSQVVSVKPL